VAGTAKALGDEWEGPKRFDYLREHLQMIQLVEPGKDRFIFALDPVAEYLAAKHFIAKVCGGDAEKVGPECAARAAGKNPAEILGFRTALADCFWADFPGAQLPAELQ
jgi:hypothetical protein